jgi:hypothetical protein
LGLDLIEERIPLHPQLGLYRFDELRARLNRAAATGSVNVVAYRLTARRIVEVEINVSRLTDSRLRQSALTPDACNRCGGRTRARRRT